MSSKPTQNPRVDGPQRAKGADGLDDPAKVVAQLHQELREIAAAYMDRERADHTLQPTALINEMYLRLEGAPLEHVQDRSHLLGIAAHLMRQILVNHAHKKNTLKRGGDWQRIPLDPALQAFEDRGGDILELNTALDEFAKVDPRRSRIVELRFFGGLTIPEVANALGVSHATVERDWATARAWLRVQLLGGI